MTDPRQSAHDAVYACLTANPDLPRTLVEHNAAVWRVAHAVIAAMGAPPDVAGRCPACRGESLMLGAGGHVTCRRLDCPDPCAADRLLHGEQADAYQQLLDRLKREHSRDLEAARLSHIEEGVIAASGMAAAFHISIAWAIHYFEGAEAREQYLRDNADDRHIHHDGPTVAEASAADRNWDVEKCGE